MSHAGNSPIRFDARDVVDLALTFRAMTGWQVVAALTGRPASAVPLALHDQLLNGVVKSLKGDGLVETHLFFPRARAHKQIESRPQYRLTADADARIESLPPKLAAIATTMKPGVWYGESVLVRAGLSAYRTSWHRREQLKIMVRAGVIEPAPDMGRGRTTLILPTAQAWRRFVEVPTELATGVRRQFRLPKGDDIHHHLLAVDGVLDVQRETGWAVARFDADEDLRSASRRGVDMRRLRGKTFDSLPDALAQFEVVPGALTAVPVEVLTSSYTDVVLARKALLPDDTRFFTETPKLVDRFFRVSGRLAKYLPGDIAPHDIPGALTIASPLATTARVARFEYERAAA